MSVLVCLATRGRPQELARMLESVQTTSPQVHVALYIDEDDRTTYPQKFGANVSVAVGPQIGPVASLNALVSTHPGFEVYVAATDDCVFDVPGWSGWLLEQREKFPKRIGVMSPFVPQASRPMNFPCATREWIATVGYFAYPRSYHFYWDVILEILGDATQSSEATKQEFVIHHDKHPSTNLEGHLSKDAKEFAVWCAYHRKPMIQRLKDAIGG